MSNVTGPMPEHLWLNRLCRATFAEAKTANCEVMWGWKRDEEQRQRMIFFSGTLYVDPESRVVLRDWYFYYSHRAQLEALDVLERQLQVPAVTAAIGQVRRERTGIQGMDRLVLAGGPGVVRCQPLIERLLQRRPRKTIPHGRFPPHQTVPLNLRGQGDVVLYAGSGLSYECGLPTLAHIHHIFGVDDPDEGRLTFGLDDAIPAQLGSDYVELFSRFCDLHIQAFHVQPSTAHRRIQELHRDGIISRVLTDNVDNVFAKLGVPFVRTRGIGLFNDRHQVAFTESERTLLVIGVAADRRGIIAQARRHGMRVVVVNPHRPVSPRSQNLSYLRPRDRWFCMTADEFTSAYIAS